MTHRVRCCSLGEDQKFFSRSPGKGLVPIFPLWLSESCQTPRYSAFLYDSQSVVISLLVDEEFCISRVTEDIITPTKMVLMKKRKRNKRTNWNVLVDCEVGSSVFAPTFLFYLWQTRIYFFLLSFILFWKKKRIENT